MKVLLDITADHGELSPEEEMKLISTEIAKLDAGRIQTKLLSFAEEVEDISDGFHSFKELYDHRIQLFIALCHATNVLIDECGGLERSPWKSKKHSDGTEWDGWFIAGIHTEQGKQISYHLPIEKWDELHVQELETAPVWDGHTPDDVLDRLKQL